MKTISQMLMGRLPLWTFLTLWGLASAAPVFAINGLEGTFEFACDAPWRMEPSKTMEYGAIPLQISIHDAKDSGADDILMHRFHPLAKEPVHIPPAILSLGKFRFVRVRQMDLPLNSGETFELASFHEIEMTIGSWPTNSTQPMPAHRICRRWAGEDPEPFRDLRNTSEWHGTLWYPPRSAVPGSTITLMIEVALERDALPEVRGPISGQVIPLEIKSRMIFLRNYVQVHFAAEPLPRFDNRWLYGDLHYHSQGTDNEGESAYNYRGVARAMGAMGLDFLFATDHASASEQLMDLDLHIDLFEEGLGKYFGGDVDQLEESDTDQTWGTLRDMDARRYRFCHGLIYGPRGVNREASLQASDKRFPQNYLSHGLVPRIFLGCEVDAIPELKLSTIGPPPPSAPGPQPVPPGTLQYYQWQLEKNAFDSWRPQPFAYGNGLTADLAELRAPGKQPLAYLYEAMGDALLIHDFQGLDTYDLYGRAHLVYFPSSDRLDLGGGDTSFIGSFTSKFGGATRRLDAFHKGSAPLLPEIERKGLAFVAHHLNSVGSSRGPDSVPWTLDHMLLKAFRSPAILGLEYWNEDSRFKTLVCSHEYCRDGGFLGQELGYERDEYFSIWGYRPDELIDVPLALPGVRQGFITGGFRGSQFELIPFRLPDGRWERATHGTDRQLHHGAHDWDAMNLLGLDFENHAKLPWLSAGEPRRVFMGGGSDAHGDLNHRRAGYFLGAEDANDTAIGKPRNLVFAGVPQGQLVLEAPPGQIPSKNGGQGGIPGLEPVGTVIRTHTQGQIIEALKAGHYCITDGPAIRMAIDVNQNGVIDDEDIQMGDVYRFNKPLVPDHKSGGQAITLLTECKSTSEFGPIQKIDIYVGVHPGDRAGAEMRVYAPSNHAVRTTHDPSSALVPASTYVSRGRAYSKMEDGYWFADELRVIPPATNRMAFTVATTIDLDQFQITKGVGADRFFVRAFAQTASNLPAQLPSRYAFTNPIWLLRSVHTTHQLPDVVFPLVIPAKRPAVSIERDDQGRLVLEFVGTLQTSRGLGLPFVDVPEATSPYLVPRSSALRIFRARD